MTAVRVILTTWLLAFSATNAAAGWKYKTGQFGHYAVVEAGGYEFGLGCTYVIYLEFVNDLTLNTPLNGSEDDEKRLNARSPKLVITADGDQSLTYDAKVNLYGGKLDVTAQIDEYDPKELAKAADFLGAARHEITMSVLLSDPEETLATQTFTAAGSTATTRRANDVCRREF